MARDCCPAILLAGMRPAIKACGCSFGSTGIAQRSAARWEGGLRSLWFTQALALEILAGRKRETIRVLRPGLPSEGEIVAAQVGPRPAFALLRIEAVEPIGLDDLDDAHRAALARHYPGSDLGATPLLRLVFRPLRENVARFARNGKPGG